MADVIFTEGLKAFKPREKAPDWVKADIVINTVEFAAFMKQHAKPDRTLRIQIKEGKTGNYYAALDTWEKPTDNEHRDHRDEAPNETAYPTHDINPDDIPF